MEQFSKFIAIIVLLRIYLPTGNLEKICYALILGDVISELIAFLYLILLYVSDMHAHLPLSKLKKYSKIHSDCNSSSNSFKFLRKILRILIPVALTSYVRSGLSTVKQLLIPSNLEKSGLNCSESLSEYGTISGMSMPIVMFPATFLSSVAWLLVPEFARYHAHNDTKKIKKYSDILIISSFAFSCLLTITFIIFGESISYAIYKDYSIGKYVKIFALLIPFMYVDIVIDSILKGIDEQVNVMFINIMDLLISICFICIFVPIFGIKGYIVSIFISEIFNFALSLKTLFGHFKKC